MIEDIAQFQVWLTREEGWNGKWVIFGASYAGSLAAIYRLKHPELVAGAIASSAPVKAWENFENFDLMVSKKAGPQCSQVLRATLAQLESSVAYPQKFSAMKALFDASEVTDPTDFLYAVSDGLATAILDGEVTSICNALVSAQDPLQALVQQTRSVSNRTLKKES